MQVQGWAHTFKHEKNNDDMNVVTKMGSEVLQFVGLLLFSFLYLFQYVFDFQMGMDWRPVAGAMVGTTWDTI